MTDTKTASDKWVVQIEGTIACGKTTLARNMKTCEAGTEVLEERVNEPFLALLYKEPKKTAFAFQAFMLSTRLAQLDSAERHGTGRLVLDRGLVGDTIFADLNHRQGNISDAELAVYASLCKSYAPRHLSDTVDVAVFLDVDPVECRRRMVELRQRKSEEVVPLDYLQKLDALYFEHMMQWIGGRPDKRFNWSTPAPPLLAFGWATYGTQLLPPTGGDDGDSVAVARRVWQMVDEVKTGKRAGAKVSFVDTRPDTVHIDSKQHIDSSSWKTSSTVVVNWQLRTDSTLRRLIWSLLEQNRSIVFVDAGTN